MLGESKIKKAIYIKKRDRWGGSENRVEEEE